ncbi:hypothetical protein KCP69_06180 [Salmonella enterica subsp. enterica]|nr:hypothetical protein KCP69_06180 [Salmonella enterica subsp. enterica]
MAHAADYRSYPARESAAGAPVVVAVNKIDKPEADPDRVKNELKPSTAFCRKSGGEPPVHVFAKARPVLTNRLMLSCRRPVLN